MPICQAKSKHHSSWAWKQITKLIPTFKQALGWQVGGASIQFGLISGLETSPCWKRPMTHHNIPHTWQDKHLNTKKKEVFHDTKMSLVKALPSNTLHQPSCSFPMANHKLDWYTQMALSLIKSTYNRLHQILFQEITPNLPWNKIWSLPSPSRVKTLHFF